jgi:hypothetical protein
LKIDYNILQFVCIIGPLQPAVLMSDMNAVIAFEVRPMVTLEPLPAIAMMISATVASTITHRLRHHGSVSVAMVAAGP